MNLVDSLPARLLRHRRDRGLEGADGPRDDFTVVLIEQLARIAPQMHLRTSGEAILMAAAASKLIFKIFTLRGR